MRRHYLNTTQPVALTAAVTSGASSLPVSSSAGMPPVPFTIGLERGTLLEEVCLITAVPDGTHLTATRGYDGTTGVAHSIGASVEHCVIAADYDEANDHVNDAGLHSFPTGIVVPYAGAPAPSGWLKCDGQAVDRGTYGALWNLLKDAAGTDSYPYGVGDGFSTFNVPDLRGRFPLGKDNMGGTSANRVTAAAADAMGGHAGTETVTLSINEMPSHTHTQTAHTHTQAPHNHLQTAHQHDVFGITPTSGIWVATVGGEAGLNAGPGGATSIEIDSQPTVAVNQATTASNNSTTAVNNSTGGSNAVNKMNPYLTLNYLIKT